jgi:V/A-type H+/Na+-transporting ATPase subunit B
MTARPEAEHQSQTAGPDSARRTPPAPIEYRSIGSIRGPLIVVQDVTDVGWDEVAQVTLDSGEIRHGTVLEVHRDLAVVEILEGTSGMRLDSARVAFSGTPMRIPVGEGWLGRTCNGRGDPIDGGPPVLGGELRPVAGAPINPAARAAPTEAILTGVSAIDGLATLVRGQKLPVFSVGGLPHLELAAQVAAQAHVEGEQFAIVFAALGLPHADVHTVRSVLERRAELGDLALFVNTADDPVVERIVTPRVALTVAEHLAFDLGRHVLVVLADLTNYCEAVRQVSAARGEVPSRRGYPGYLYSDLASLLERAGRIKDVQGSLTQVPVLTMPAGDITHPVPDVTGYITEGQLVLSAEAYARGISPPLDPLASLSRLMGHGAGPGLTRDDHLEIAAQLYGIAARGRQAADLAEVVGEDALAESDRHYLRVAAAFESDFLSQPLDQSRSLEDTLDRAWAVASRLPRHELSMITPATLDAHYVDGVADSPR